MEEVVKNAHQLGELVGLSLRSVSNCPMELNLRPVTVVNAHRIAARRPYLIATGVCLLLALAGWYLYFLRAANIQEGVLNGVSEKVAAMQNFENRFKSITTDMKGITATSAPLTQIVDDRQFWARVISELNARLPQKYVWITLLEATSNGKPVILGDPSKPLASGPSSATAAAPAAPGRPGAVVPKVLAIDGLHIKGLYLHNDRRDQVVSDFKDNLAKSPFFKLDAKNEKSIILNRAPENDKDWAFDYELQLNLAQPHPLQ